MSQLTLTGKNIHRSKEEWGIVSAVIKSRKDEGEESEVFIWGSKVPANTLHRATTRPRLPYTDQWRLSQGISFDYNGQDQD